MKEKKTKRGGFRIGAGAKPKYNEPTTTVSVRCPVSRTEELKEYITAKLDTWKSKSK